MPATKQFPTKLVHTLKTHNGELLLHPLATLVIN
jgi:hypothetical protein